MTITITPAAGSAVVLCHGAARAEGNGVGPDAYSLRRVPGLLRREYVEDPGVRIEHVGNDEVSGSFSVVHRCASKSAAATKVSAILNSTPASGTLTDGTLTVYDCGMTDISARQSGRAVYASYAFTGSLTAEVTE